MPPDRIDIHHHILPEPYLAAARDRIIAGADVDPTPLLSWTREGALDALDRHGIATAVTSISTPGIWFGDASAAARLARACNEYAAEMSRDFPGRFGFFAALPLPDIDATLAEIAYALDVLGAEGVGILTSYGDVWPGDPVFAPVFDELQRRGTLVFVHPTVPTCCRTTLPGIAPALNEFLFDTTRAISSLLFGGIFARCRAVRFIFTHAGGTMPPLAMRIEQYGRRHRELAERIPDGVLPELRRLFYDVANATNPIQMAAITQLVPPEQIVFGSDYPYVPIARTVDGFAGLGLEPAFVDAIDRGNALRLLPRYGA